MAKSKKPAEEKEEKKESKPLKTKYIGIYRTKKNYHDQLNRNDYPDAPWNESCSVQVYNEANFTDVLPLHCVITSKAEIKKAYEDAGVQVIDSKE